MTSCLSLVAKFDDLCRNGAVFFEGAEPEFLQFAKNQEVCRKRWLTAELECERLQGVVMKLQNDLDSMEVKMKHARQLLDKEMKEKRHVQKEKDALERLIGRLKDLLQSDQKSRNDETREVLALLNSTCQGGRWSNMDSPGANNKLETINELDSTGSVLSASDLSYDRSEDDLDVSVLRTGKVWKKKRPSLSARESEAPKRRRSSTKVKEDTYAVSGKRVVARTTVTVPREGGPITASSVIEAQPKSSSDEEKTSGSKYNNTVGFVNPAAYPSAPPMPVAESVESEDSFWGGPRQTRSSITSQRATPISSGSPTLGCMFGSKSNCRPHAFCQKTVIKPETCGPCGKRIKFSKMAYKCKDCRATCHPDCKDEVPLPCVPVVNTPTAKSGLGVIGDFTPGSSPMVPALVVHCIREIETRGLSEVGIYRIPGSEREVKDLKERLLSAKSGIPNLTKIDVHVICGALKDFLRSLREPLVTHSLWNDFVKAADQTDDHDVQTSLCQVISQLPQPNRDTLALLILHLQKISNSPDCKMTTINLSRVFGPTIVGHSFGDHDPPTMLAETRKQQKVMIELLSLGSDYWSRFVCGDFTKETPDQSHGLYNILGPINLSTGAHNRGGTLVTPLSSRSRSVKKRFFSTPPQQKK